MMHRNMIVTPGRVSFVCPMTGEYDYVAWSNTPAGEPTEWIPLPGSLSLEKGDLVSITPCIAVSAES